MSTNHRCTRGRMLIAVLVVLALTLGTGAAVAAPVDEMPITADELRGTRTWKNLVEWIVEMFNDREGTPDEPGDSTTALPPEGDEGPGMTPDG